MSMRWAVVAGCCIAVLAAAEGGETSARRLVEGALDLQRGKTSLVSYAMRVKRPDWQRSFALKAWSRGREDSLIRFTAPPKDIGNAILTQGEKMWIYTPKLNRTIRLPYSMRSQSWAGTDFSYDDLSRTDGLLKHYQLRIAETRTEADHQIYVIEAIPYDSAPIVWGMERWVLRDDFVLLEQAFFDQAMQLVKRMVALEIGELGGRTLAVRMRMERMDKPGHWTEVHLREAAFDLSLGPQFFTVQALQSDGGG